MRKERVYLTAVAVDRGVINVINPNGELGLYAQRGIKKLRPDEATVAIERGLINPIAFSLQELPSNYSIAFESAEHQGRAVASFNKNVLYRG